MLTQHQLCHADASLMAYRWMEEDEPSQPDVSMNKRCRDPAQLLSYRDQYSVDMDKYKAWKKLEGVFAWSEDSFYSTPRARSCCFFP